MLNIIALLLICGSGVGGYFLIPELTDMKITEYGGIIIGVLLGFIVVVITLGVPFIVLEINNNLIRIKDILHKGANKSG
jgi:hypothetical protein